MAGCGMPVVCMPEPSIRAHTHHPIEGKPGISDVWEGRWWWRQPLVFPGLGPLPPLPCFWLMSAGKWGEWEPWLKCGWTPCDGCTTGTLLDCKTQGEGSRGVRHGAGGLRAAATRPPARERAAREPPTGRSAGAIASPASARLQRASVPSAAPGQGGKCPRLNK
uniref:Uncharacterized protein n=1 Tax=Apteryx owenii TaxID=8824 RepID=A0A8B9PWU8_APTOW